MKPNRYYFLLLSLAIACQTATDTTGEKLSYPCAMGDSLSHTFIITDGHVDLPYRMSVQNFQLVRDYLEELDSTKDEDFDLQRARAGGLDAPFMSIFISSLYQETGNAKAYADSLIDLVERIAKS
jgi:membrane dipeptidase